MKEPFNGFPFKSWNQGYFLGIVNGTVIGLTIMLILYFLHKI